LFRAEQFAAGSRQWAVGSAQRRWPSVPRGTIFNLPLLVLRAGAGGGQVGGHVTASNQQPVTSNKPFVPRGTFIRPLPTAHCPLPTANCSARNNLQHAI